MGLTSPFLFNLFYQDLIDSLSNLNSGLKINTVSYNVFAYADDLLLLSSTATGLQRLIDHANSYICQNGLGFNANKTKCAIFGKCHLSPQPKWFLDRSPLKLCDDLDYLGATLSTNCATAHKNNRLAACRGRYFTLQSAGMHRGGVKPSILAYLWKSAIQPALTYANETVALRTSQLIEMDKLQAKLIKNSLGFSKYLRSTALLKAMQIKHVSRTIPVNSMKLLRTMFTSQTRSRQFYLHACKNYCVKDNNLYIRCRKFSESQNISLTNVILSQLCFKNFQRKCLHDCNDGLSDSISMLLRSFTTEDQRFIKMLLSPF